MLDDSCQRILETVRSTGTEVVGPIPLPTRRRIYCVLRSPHVNKDAREHFEIRTHKRIIDVYRPTETTLENLRNPKIEYSQSCISLFFVDFNLLGLNL